MAHGGAVATYDIDLAVARDPRNARAVADALAEFNPWPRGFDRSLPFKWDGQTVNSSALLNLETEVGDVDLIGETPGVSSFAELYEQAEVIDVVGCKVRVASLEHLLAMKLAINRLKDALHIIELKSLLGSDNETV